LVAAATRIFTFDSSRRLSRHSILVLDSRMARSASAMRDLELQPRGDNGAQSGIGGVDMTHYESEAAFAAGNASADSLYELGIASASGRSAPADLVAAHKWFNLAAIKGHREAARMRREIATEMTDAEIGQAQRAARDWLKSQPGETPVAPQLRAAA
jgi:TPR repeat protein